MGFVPIIKMGAESLKKDKYIASYPNHTSMVGYNEGLLKSQVKTPLFYRKKELANIYHFLVFFYKRVLHYGEIGKL